ncbi:MAG TPA: hypothetical protein VNH83_12070, partial [Bryobacteraceae bacterium]|nr:hypothetical protein [Bryobacteraceae bacterium]
GRLPNFRSVVLVYDPTTEFHCRKLAEDVYLLTYTLTQSEERKTLRSTIWQHTAQGWQIVYHQGTIVQDV